jgi:hypothetical protein
MPLRKWGNRKVLVVVVPLATIVAIYSIAYGVGAFIGVERDAPRWVGFKQIAINIVVTGIIHGALTSFGALGEELGWRGYMLPRLDQLGVRGSLGILVVVWTGCGFVAGMARGLSLPGPLSGPNDLDGDGAPRSFKKSSETDLIDEITRKTTDLDTARIDSPHAIGGWSDTRAWPPSEAVPALICDGIVATCRFPEDLG